MERKVAPKLVLPFVPQILRRKGVNEQGAPGKRSQAYAAQGYDVRATRKGNGFHLIGSIMAAVERGARITDGMLAFQPQDLRQAIRRGTEGNLIVFLVDASGSMAGRNRLSAVTGAVLSMLRDAYQRRDKVAVIAVRGSAPTLVLPPTSSIDIAVRRLEKTVTGGRTPLGEGLIMAQELMQREAHKDPTRRALLVVLSDGRATGKSGRQGVEQAARGIAQSGICGSIVIDCEQGRRIKLGLAKELAKNLGAQCVGMEHLHADAVSGLIQAI